MSVTHKPPTVKIPTVKIPTQKQPTVKLPTQKLPSVSLRRQRMEQPPINLRLPSDIGLNKQRFSGSIDPDIRGGQVTLYGNNGWNFRGGHHTPSKPTELPVALPYEIGLDMPFPRFRRKRRN